ncbi:MAG: universal stress protein [Bacteroidales bacterium]|nr:universal stress protein [Bacteroidales bacterium]
MSKLLIPTDFADQSFPLIDYAVELAYSMRLGVELFFCLDISKFTAPYFHFELNDLPCDLNDYAEVYENVGQRCHNYINSIKKRYGKEFQIDYITSSGWYASQVLECIENADISLLVIHGKKKYGFLDRLVQNAECIMINEAPCLIWVIPPDYKFRCIKNILFITDSGDWDFKAIKNLYHWKEYFGASLQVLNISKTKEDIEQLRKQISDNQDILFDVMGKKISPSRINKYIKESGFDLVVLNKRERKFLGESMPRKQIRKFVFETSLPVLLYQIEEKLTQNLMNKKYRRLEQ